MTQPIDHDARVHLETRLRGLDGVVHAAFDADTSVIWLVHGPQDESAPIELAARSLVASLGFDPTTTPIRVASPTPTQPRRRVRFVSAVRAPHSDGVTINVTLEWNDTLHSGSATGERGLAVELKTAATAAVQAVESVAAQPLGLRIIGVKQVHAFDSTIMVASIHRTQGAPQRLVGAVLVTAEPIHAAAIAVLSGLNRILGNFLHTAD